MRHQDLTINHILESWVFANAAARTAAGSYVSGDVGRIGYQTDTAQYWRLTATTPTWQLLPGAVPPGGTAGQLLTKNSATGYDAAWATLAGLPSATGGPADPVGTSNTSGVMMGLGAAVRYTPVKSGKFLVIWSAGITSTVAGGGAQGSLSIGSGAAPGNGAASVGGIGGAFTCVCSPAAPNNYVPVSLVTLFTGSVGVNYWIDVNIRNFAAAGTVKPGSNYFAIVEL